MSANKYSGGLRLRTIKASAWTVLEYGISLLLRFSTNLILTRLLVPEVFGIMQLVFAFLYALEMFSDLGVSINIIRHRRAEDIVFRRTAWTFQIGRGLIIWACCFLIAWPIFKIYDDDRLLSLLPLIGLNAVLCGMCSTNLPLFQRQLKLRPLFFLNLFSQIAGLVATIVFVRISPTPLSLVGGFLIGSSCRMLISHLLMSDFPMKLCWELAAAKEIFSFGKWIFLSSILACATMHLDKIILGLYMTKHQLGLYGIAIAIAMVNIQIVQKLSSAVLLSVYTKLLQQSIPMIRKKITKIRVVLMLCLMLPSYCLMLWGQEIVSLLYPKEYWDAGMMLKILAFGASIACITRTIDPILLAAGNSFRLTLFLTFRALAQIVLVVLGGWYFGLMGMLVGLASTEIVSYPVLVLSIRKYNVWLPILDFTGIALTILVASKAFIWR